MFNLSNSVEKFLKFIQEIFFNATFTEKYYAPSQLQLPSGSSPNRGAKNPSKRKEPNVKNTNLKKKPEEVKTNNSTETSKLNQPKLKRDEPVLVTTKVDPTEVPEVKKEIQVSQSKFVPNHQRNEYSEYIDLDTKTGELWEDWIEESPGKLKNQIYKTFDQVRIWKENRNRHKLLEDQFSGILKKNLKEEKKLIDQVLKDVKKWQKEVETKLKTAHTIEPQTNFPFLNEENLNAFIQKYENQKFLTELDRELFCDNFHEDYIEKNRNSNTKSVSVIGSENLNCAQKLQIIKGERNLAREQFSQANRQKTMAEHLVKIYNQELDLKKSELMSCQKNVINSQQLIQESEKLGTKNTQLSQTIFQNEKTLKYNNAHIRKLEKEVDRCHRKLSHWKVVPTVGHLFEIIFEVLCFPYAMYNENSILHKVLKAGGHKLSADKRMGLTIMLGFLWTILVVNYFIPEFREMIWMSKNKTSENNNESEKTKEKKLNWPSPLNVRGGAQQSLMDPVYIEIISIKISNKLAANSLETKNSGSKSSIVSKTYRKINRKIKKNRILIRLIVILVATRPQLNLTRYPEFEERPPFEYTLDKIEKSMSEDVDVPQTSSNIKIYLPSSNTVISGKSGKVTSGKNRVTSGKKTVKLNRNVSKIKKKRVMKFSDLPPCSDFENVETYCTSPQIQKISMKVKNQ